MEKLELKHLAGYLPFGLKAYRENKSVLSDVFVIKGSTKENVFLSENGLVVVDVDRIKPILRPLSDLTKEIKVNGEKFLPKNLLKSWNEGIYHTSDGIKIFFDEVCYKDIQKLYEWHFDIHGLIEKGLAIDINTLNK